jgi:hypothetical protein
MTAQFNRIPTYTEPLTTKGATTRGWFSFWAGLFSGQPTGPVSQLTLQPSPWTYVASAAGSLLISGGSVTQVKFSRDGANFYVTGATAGLFPLAQGDTLQITYTGTPQVLFVPR